MTRFVSVAIKQTLSRFIGGQTIPCNLPEGDSLNSRQICQIIDETWYTAVVSQKVIKRQ